MASDGDRLREQTSDAPATSGALRVLVVADDPLVRSGLALLLAREVQVVAQIALRDDLPSAIRAERAAVVLLDLGADPRSVSDRLADLAELPVPFVALVPSESSAGETVAAGAAGVLLRGVDAPALGAALHAAARGLLVLDASLASLMPARDRSSLPIAEDLTAREVEVLQQLAAGLSNKLIGNKLGISEHTVKFHVNSVMSKLGVESRTEAVVRAARLGLVIL